MGRGCPSAIGNIVGSLEISAPSYKAENSVELYKVKLADRRGDMVFVKVRRHCSLSFKVRHAVIYYVAKALIFYLLLKLSQPYQDLTQPCQVHTPVP